MVKVYPIFENGRSLKMSGDDFNSASDRASFLGWQEDEKLDEMLENDDNLEYDEEEDCYVTKLDPTPRESMVEFGYCVSKIAKLSRNQKMALGLLSLGKTQTEIAKELKISQPAVSKAIDTGRKKIEDISKKLGGGHSHLETQAMHWWRSKKE